MSTLRIRTQRIETVIGLQLLVTNPEKRLWVLFLYSMKTKHGGIDVQLNSPLYHYL